MNVLPSNSYVEVRDGAYYIAGTRIGLDVLIYDFRRGESPEAIFESYPSIGSLANVYGAITFILENPEAVEQYLCEQEARWRRLREKHPLPEDLLAQFREDKTPPV
jgi:uncharacterized protein (DUF433 family)